MKHVLLGSLLFFAMAVQAFAIHDFDPPWAPGTPGSTSQAWEFWGNPLGTTTPSHVNNPYGTPTFQPVNASPQFEPNGPGLTGVNTWHVDVDGGGFLLGIPNNPQPNEIKYIHLQYTSDKAGGAPSTTPPGTASAGGVAGHGPSSGGDAWYTYEWNLTIQPNPPFEQIFIPFPASANIGEIEVATLCTVPEPSSLILAGLGVIGLVVGCARRRA